MRERTAALLEAAAICERVAESQALNRDQCFMRGEARVADVFNGGYSAAAICAAAILELASYDKAA